MDLKKFVSAHKKKMMHWLNFNNFEIELIYCDRHEMEKMLEQSKKRIFDQKTHQPVEIYDDELFAQQMASKINDWKSLTIGKLAQMTNIDIAGENPDQLIPCTFENKRELVGEIYGLNNFLRETITEIEIFRSNQLDQEKKTLPTSPDSS